MNSTESALTFRSILAGLDDREKGMGLPPVAEQDLTPRERATEVYVRLNRAVADTDLPDLDLIEQAGAHLVALHQAVARAHALRVETGDELPAVAA